MVEKLTSDNIAEDYMIGNTRVRIATDYCKDKTPDEVQMILDRIAQKAQPLLVAEMLKKSTEQK